MFQLDLEKAFDRVVHKVFFSDLERIDLGAVLLMGFKMKMADKKCFANIIVNKNLSEGSQGRSSVKQGCPLSPLLFAIYLGPLFKAY